MKADIVCIDVSALWALVYNRKYPSTLNDLRFEDTFDDENETSFQEFCKYFNHH